MIIKMPLFFTKLCEKIEAREIIVDDQIAKLSLVGLGMESHAGVASKIFQALDSENIPIYLITSTESKISTIIDENTWKQVRKYCITLLIYILRNQNFLPKNKMLLNGSFARYYTPVMSL